MVKHFNIKISGRVQKVMFRLSAKDMADKLNITGFVQNLADGSLYIEAEGEEENLNEFLNWCKQGPESAQVDSIESTEGPLKNFSDFSVR